MSSWTLAIDFGTSFTTAATRDEGEREAVLLEFGDALGTQSRMPSLVLVEPAELVVGWTAYRQTALAAERVWWTPKRSLGLQRFEIGGRELDPSEAVAAILAAVRTEALRRHGDGQPASVRLTHPARWAGTKLQALREAARRAGIEQPLLLSEPVAAAIHYGGKRLAPGELVAVYDLGGGTFDTAVLASTGQGEFELVGRPDGDETLGGELFDRRLSELLGAQLEAESPADWQRLQDSRRARDSFRKRVREAKEGLSDASSYDLQLPEGIERESLRVTREEFERLIRADVERTIVILERTLEAAGVEPAALSAVYVTGGASRTPLVDRLLQERFGPEKTTTLGDPKTVVALGAAAYESEAKKAPPPVPPPPPPRRPPPLPPPAPPRPAARRAPLPLVAVGAALLLLVIAVIVAVVAFGGSDSAGQAGGSSSPPPVAPPPVAPPPVESTPSGGSFPGTPAEHTLYRDIIPSEVSDCERVENPAPEADAAAICNFENGLGAIYESFPDSDSMYTVYSRILAGADVTLAFDGDCPDDESGESAWEDTDEGATRGQWACYLTESQTDAHLMWTHDEYDVLAVVSHEGLSANFRPLLAYWRANGDAFGT